ncbi:MAG: hypothetical protein NWF11_03465 [Candidatus Bathyarchaeota archaeon]|nr:hypothetical protein [Candidatus Bathyarchaeota archaeon]
MKNNAKSDYTIRFVDKALRYLYKNTDVSKPKEVKNFIANKNVSNGYKKTLCLAYDKYCQCYGARLSISDCSVHIYDSAGCDSLS